MGNDARTIEQHRFTLDLNIEDQQNLSAQVFQHIKFQQEPDKGQDKAPAPSTGTLPNLPALYFKDVRQHSPTAEKYFRPSHMEEPKVKQFEEKAIVPENVQQRYKDGYFMAAVASLTTSNEGRELIKSMIKNNGDNSFTVTFPGDKNHPIRIERSDFPWANTPMEFSYKTNFNQLIELAFIKRQYGKVDDHYANWNQEDDFSGTIKTSNAALRLLTGQEVQQLLPTDSKMTTERLKQELITAMDRGQPITARTGSQFLLFFGRHQPLWDEHSWSVESYDEDRDQLKIHDTLGHNAYWNGRTIDGITSAEGGYFTMSMKTFHDNFDYVDVGKAK